MRTRTLFQVLATGAAYYFATRVAWALTFPDSNVSLFFPPHAVLVAALLLVPTRHWWAYTLAGAVSHFFATQQVGWPLPYALQAEAFDAVKNVLAAAGIRFFVKSPFHRITTREAVLFVLIAAVVVPFGTAFWGAAISGSNAGVTDYWVQIRDLGVSNGVTAMVLVPVIMIVAETFPWRGLHAEPRRLLEASVLGAGILAVGGIIFTSAPRGPETSPALIYAPLPLLMWAAIRFGLAGVTSSMVGITVLAIWGAMQGNGPFLGRTPTENAAALQLFLLMAATPLLLLAVAIEDDRRSTRALILSDERVRLAEKSAKLAIWEWDVTNDTVWLTDEGRTFFGFERGKPVEAQELAGRVHPDDTSVRAAAIRGAVETSGMYEAEFRIILPDGTLKWVTARGFAGHPAGGASQRILGVTIDITRQKQANAEALLQREELAHLSRVATVSALSGSLAHELSQPLSSILSNAQVGQRFTSQETPDLVQLREIFADIVSADLHAGEIIERLRTMLRRGQVALQPVDVRASLEELLRFSGPDLTERGVTVTRLEDADLPAAMTDRVQLQQVLLNLIVNACDAMAANARENRVLTLTTSVVGHEVRIGVLDRGVGLPDDTDTVFQPFYTTKAGGLGMGLSICRTLVTSHGGSLWAERRPDGGAAFYVALPLVPRDFAETTRVTVLPHGDTVRRSLLRS